MQKYLKNHFSKNTIFKNKFFILKTYFFLVFLIRRRKLFGYLPGQTSGPNTYF